MRRLRLHQCEQYCGCKSIERCCEPAGATAPLTWQQSPSFGFVKAAKATEKSYIVSKERLGKPTCLLNVQGTGAVDRGQIVEELMAWLLNRSGLTKAMVHRERGAVRETEG